ncbi:hypothetical protein K505DRAFT_382009 [Melanomma pulvis-pyrius CBS 109.77]|uniref:Uncharacterized protein n=1 Tax=Melanomma pulvis-pyrius CBS 109.77 TaxID=1314802 RepID=A0A6A6XID1_9PLEO|nr:hypothetical protein K505DRAFT_382009 [Melanomma pulvis-pyrius CBS 109.77]
MASNSQPQGGAANHVSDHAVQVMLLQVMKANTAVIEAQAAAMQCAVSAVDPPKTSLEPTNLPTGPEEAMVIILNTICESDFFPLLNVSLANTTQQNVPHLPAEVVDPFPSPLRATYKERLIAAFRTFSVKARNPADDQSQFPMSFMDVFASCVERRCAMVAIASAITKEHQTMHYTNISNKTIMLVERMDDSNAQSIIDAIHNRRNAYNLARSTPKSTIEVDEIIKGIDQLRTQHKRLRTKKSVPTESTVESGSIPMDVISEEIPAPAAPESSEGNGDEPTRRSPEEEAKLLMGHVVNLVTYNNMKRAGRLTANPYTLRKDQEAGAAESLVEAQWYRTRDLRGEPPSKLENLSNVRALLQEALDEPSRGKWEDIAYVMLQKIVGKDTWPAESELQYVFYQERTERVRRVLHALCTANRDLVRKGISNLDWPAMKGLACEVELKALVSSAEVDVSDPSFLPGVYFQAMDECEERWRKEKTIRDYNAEKVMLGRDFD